MLSRARSGFYEQHSHLFKNFLKAVRTLRSLKIMKNIRKHSRIRRML